MKKNKWYQESSLYNFVDFGMFIKMVPFMDGSGLRMKKRAVVPLEMASEMVWKNMRCI